MKKSTTTITLKAVSITLSFILANTNLFARSSYRPSDIDHSRGRSLDRTTEPTRRGVGRPTLQRGSGASEGMSREQRSAKFDRSSALFHRGDMNSPKFEKTESGGLKRTARLSGTGLGMTQNGSLLASAKLETFQESGISEALNTYLGDKSLSMDSDSRLHVRFDVSDSGEVSIMDVKIKARPTPRHGRFLVFDGSNWDKVTPGKQAPVNSEDRQTAPRTRPETNITQGDALISDGGIPEVGTNQIASPSYEASEASSAQMQGLAGGRGAADVTSYQQGTETTIAITPKPQSRVTIPDLGNITIPTTGSRPTIAISPTGSRMVALPADSIKANSSNLMAIANSNPELTDTITTGIQQANQGANVTMIFTLPAGGGKPAVKVGNDVQLSAAASKPGASPSLVHVAKNSIGVNFQPQFKTPNQTAAAFVTTNTDAPGTGNNQTLIPPAQLQGAQITNNGPADQGFIPVNAKLPSGQTIALSIGLHEGSIHYADDQNGPMTLGVAQTALAAGGQPSQVHYTGSMYTMPLPTNKQVGFTAPNGGGRTRITPRGEGNMLFMTGGGTRNGVHVPGGQVVAVRLNTASEGLAGDRGFATRRGASHLLLYSNKDNSFTMKAVNVDRPNSLGQNVPFINYSPTLAIIGTPPPDPLVVR